MKSGVLLLFPLALATADLSANDNPAPPAVRANVSIMLTVGKVEESKEPTQRTYKMLGQDGSTTRMLMGWRTPIPTRQSPEDSAEQSSVSYVYQNLGVSADLETNSLGSGRVLVQGQVEISGARGERLGNVPSGKAPQIGTFQHALRVVLQEGKRLRVAEVPDPEGGTLFLDLEVDLLE